MLCFVEEAGKRSSRSKLKAKRGKKRRVAALSELDPDVGEHGSVLDGDEMDEDDEVRELVRRNSPRSTEEIQSPRSKIRQGFPRDSTAVETTSSQQKKVRLDLKAR